MEPVKPIEMEQKSENKEMSTSSNESKADTGKSSISDDKFVKPTLKRTRSRKKIKNNLSDTGELHIFHLYLSIPISINF